MIEEVAGKPEECLNLKSEWAGSKLPGISVSKPKGTSGKEMEGTEATKRGRLKEKESVGRQTQPATEEEPERPSKKVRRKEGKGE